MSWADAGQECIFTIICNFVKKPESLDQVHEMAKLISFILSQHPSDKHAFRFKIFCFWGHSALCSSSHFSLFNLYNLLENPYSHFSVYMKALNLAINRKVVEHFLPSFKKIDSFLKEWNLEVKDQRGLFLKISNILKETKG
ncbi:hypothetical protein R3W88_004946 [Solanum pinnatisectum]|uniref:Uncharacterized protein n=1 Tax=Solanum pinnatisectum TaxID=50273 RepID=A0AAV9KB79_9SOLN|nr:hypothetical protein R3W88_004946 [Solanum pinnatisectum]